jgi:Fur family zinc uptake transcriptional regulator
MNNIDAIIQHAELHCANNGSRLTNKRKQVLSSLIKSGKAISAYDLIDLCEQMFGEKIPAMSVYRILDFLENQDLVHKLNVANKYVACSNISCDHVHDVSLFLICSVCNQVEENSINQPITNQLKQTVINAGFTLVKSHLEMRCICQSCLQSDNSGNRPESKR